MTFEFDWQIGSVVRVRIEGVVPLILSFAPQFIPFSSLFM
jgi:hypothetical protein